MKIKKILRSIGIACLCAFIGFWIINQNVLYAEDEHVTEAQQEEPAEMPDDSVNLAAEDQGQEAEEPDGPEDTEDVEEVTGADIELELRGSNKLECGNSSTSSSLNVNTAGLTVPAGASVHIYGSRSDKLEATGKRYGAGIGGYRNVGSGEITISGGRVTATGGTNVAGIGSGYGTSADPLPCEAITISGDAIVEATGAATGIGGGYYSSSTSIEISGEATVEATATTAIAGAGIGGGYYGSSDSIEISGSAQVLATSGNGAGIGGGYYGSSNNVVITDQAMVDVVVRSYGAGIGGGYGSASYPGNSGEITIDQYAKLQYF